MSALGTLAGVIVFLYRINQKGVEKIEERSDRIEKRHDETTQELVEMSGKVGRLEGEIHLAKKVVPMIEQLHGDFLKRFPDDE
jgi:hypothetical protein